MTDDRKAFAELLHDMLEQAQINGNQILQEEIQEYFEDLSLTEEQMNHIYSYLVAHRIKVKGFVPSAGVREESHAYEEMEQESGLEDSGAEEEGRAAEDSAEEKSVKKTAKSTSGKTEEPEPDSAFLRMYLKELRSLEKLTKAEERELAERLVALVAKEAALEAEEEHLFHELKNRFVEHKLRHVVSRARKYSLGGEWLDELIQEGNIGLMAAVQMLAEQAGGGKPAGAVNGRILNADSFQDTDSPRAADNFQDADSFLAFVEEQIGEAMDRYINESYASGSEEQAMVAKVNFVSEAAKALKEETGQEPTLAEMAAYTNITEDELSSIINLSADNLKA